VTDHILWLGDSSRQNLGRLGHCPTSRLDTIGHKTRYIMPEWLGNVVDSHTSPSFPLFTIALSPALAKSIDHISSIHIPVVLRLLSSIICLKVGSQV